MSLEELDGHGVFLPESAWGKMEHSASVDPSLVAGVIVLGLVSVSAMTMGEGGVWTWVGAGLFVVFMVLFTWTSNRGVDRQNRVIDEFLRQSHSSSSPPYSSQQEFRQIE